MHWPRRRVAIQNLPGEVQPRAGDAAGLDVIPQQAEQSHVSTYIAKRSDAISQIQRNQIRRVHDMDVHVHQTGNEPFPRE